MKTKESTKVCLNKIATGITTAISLFLISIFAI